MSSPTDQKPATDQGRIRFLLIVLGVVAAGALMYATWPAAEPKGAPSNQGRDARKAQPTTGSAASLQVKLDDLKQPPPGASEAARNPFRFYVKPPPPPPPAPRTPITGPSGPPRPPTNDPNSPNYVPPPITIKCIGVMEQGKTKVAIFSDGKGQPVWASEGGVVLGQYKLLKIGVESVTMSYLDGRGVQTIPIRGQ